MKNLKYLFGVFLGLFLFCGPKKNDENFQILAKTGNSTISLREFRNRYEFTPKIHTYGTDSTTKAHFLAGLISEKLLSQIARAQCLDTLQSIQLYRQQYENEAIIEALFDQEIASQIKIEEDELRQAYVHSQQTLFLRYFFTESEEAANSAQQQLKSGRPFETVGRETLQLDQIFVDSLPVKQIKWGEALETVEDSVFRLEPQNFTGPIKVDQRHFFFKLINKQSNVLLGEDEFSQQRESLAEVIRKRHRTKLFRQFIINLLRDTRVTVPHQKFNQVAEIMETAFEIPEVPTQTNPAQTNSTMRLQDNSELLVQIENLRQEPLVIFSDGTNWSVNTVLQRLKVGPYPLNYRSKNQFRASLRQAIRFMIELETLAAEGRRQYLENTAYVKDETRMWEDSYLAEAMRRQILPDSLAVSDQELIAYQHQHPERYTTQPKINIQEILVNDFNLAQTLLKKIKAGADMGKLARRYSQRQISAKKSGISGYFSQGGWGIVGKAAFEREIGEIGGPIKTETGQFSVFRIIDKKPAELIPLDKIKSQVRQDWVDRYTSQAIEDFICKKLPGSVPEIDYELLKSIPLIDRGAGMYVVKQHFPGRSAVPLVFPTDKMPRWNALIFQETQK